jgi:hypothetical protein
MSAFHVLKADIAAARQFAETAAIIAAQLRENAESLQIAFLRIAPHASGQPVVAETAALVAQFVALAQQIHPLGIPPYHAIDDVDSAFQ